MAKSENHEFRLFRSDAHENHLTVYCKDILIRLDFENKTGKYFNNLTQIRLITLIFLS